MDPNFRTKDQILKIIIVVSLVLMGEFTKDSTAFFTVDFLFMMIIIVSIESLVRLHTNYALDEFIDYAFPFKTTMRCVRCKGKGEYKGETCPICNGDKKVEVIITKEKEDTDV